MSDNQNSGSIENPDQFFSTPDYSEPDPGQNQNGQLSNMAEQIPISDTSGPVDTPSAFPGVPQPGSQGYPPQPEATVLGGPPQTGAYPPPEPYPAQPGPYPPPEANSAQPGSYPPPEANPAQPGAYPPPGAYPAPGAYSGPAPSSPPQPYTPQGQYPPQQGYVPQQTGQQYQPYPGQTPPYGYAQQPYQPGYSQPSAQLTAPPKTKNKAGVIVGIVCAVVVLAVLGIAISRIFSTPSTTVPTSTTSQKPKPTYTPSPKTPTSSPVAPTSAGGHPTVSIGDTVTVDYGSMGELDYSVTGEVTTMESINTILTADPGMVYVVIPVTITYQGTRSLFNYDDNDAVVVSADGTQYDPDSSAEILYAMPDGSPNMIWLAMLKPGGSASGVLIYQVDEDDVAGLRLLVGVFADTAYSVDLEI